MSDIRKINCKKIDFKKPDFKRFNLELKLKR